MNDATIFHASDYCKNVIKAFSRQKFEQSSGRAKPHLIDWKLCFKFSKRFGRDLKTKKNPKCYFKFVSNLNIHFYAAHMSQACRLHWENLNFLQKCCEKRTSGTTLPLVTFTIAGLHAYLQLKGILKIFICWWTLAYNVCKKVTSSFWGKEASCWLYRWLNYRILRLKDIFMGLEWIIS